MSGAEAAARRQGRGLYYRNYLTNPLRMGAVMPSSATLCRLIAAQVRRKADEAVLELGAGTGAVTRALLASGVPADRLIVLEIEAEMARHLAALVAPGHALQGDAFAVAELLPRHWHGRIGTVICGVPMVMMPRDRQKALIAAMDAVAPGRGFLHYTFCATSPLPWRPLGLSAKREAWTCRNFPPASVWRYAPAHRTDPTPSCGAMPDVTGAEPRQDPSPKGESRDSSRSA